MDGNVADPDTLYPTARFPDASIAALPIQRCSAPGAKLACSWTA
jgi:hypothetical protein